MQTELQQLMDTAFEAIRSFRQFRPKNANLLIKKYEEKEEIRPSGIVLPDSAKKTNARGIVVAAGPGFRMSDGTRQPMEVNKGDLVIFSPYAGVELKINDEEFVLLSEEAIYGTILFGDEAEPS